VAATQADIHSDALGHNDGYGGIAGRADGMLGQFVPANTDNNKLDPGDGELWERYTEHSNLAYCAVMLCGV